MNPGTVEQVVYDYYGVNDDNGNPGDLKTAVVKDAGNNTCPSNQPHLRAGDLTRHHAAHLEVSHGCTVKEYQRQRLA